MRRVSYIAVAALTGAALVLPACGSSKSSANATSNTTTSGSSSNSSTPATAGATGSAVRLMVTGIGPDAPGGLAGAAVYDDVATNVLAEAASVNAAGGANGHKIQVDVCWDQGDPNLASGCARKAVSQHDVAVLAPLTVNGDSILPILAAAHIPVFGNTPVSPSDYSSSDSFPIAGGDPVDYGGLGVLLATHGCSKLGILYDTQGNTEAGVPFVVQGAKANHATTVAKVPVGATVADVSPEVAKIEAAGAQCIALAGTVVQDTGAVQAVAQSGKKLILAGITASLPTSVLKTLGSVGNGLLLAGGEALPTDTGIPQVQQMLATAKKYEPGMEQPTSNFGVLGWGAATLLMGKVIPGISGPVTGSTVTKGIEALRDASTGVAAPYSGNASPPLAAYPRLISYGALFWKLENGTPTLLSPSFTNLAPSMSS